VHLVRLFVGKFGNEILEKVDYLGNTLLHTAASMGQKEMFDCLIKEFNCSTTAQNSLEKVAEFYWEQQNSLPIQQFESKKTSRRKKVASSVNLEEKNMIKRASMSLKRFKCGSKTNIDKKEGGANEKGLDNSLVTLDKKQDDNEGENDLMFPAIPETGPERPEKIEIAPSENSENTAETGVLEPKTRSSSPKLMQITPPKPTKQKTTKKRSKTPQKRYQVQASTTHHQKIPQSRNRKRTWKERK